MAPLQAHCVQKGCSNIWCGYGTGQSHQAIVGWSHTIKNTVHFMKHIKPLKLQQEYCMVTYDVTALFTSVPVDPAISIVKSKLLQDSLLSHRTSISIPQIITLHEVCLKNTYLFFWGKYFEQVHGAAMGSPIRSLITNLFMEEFGSKAISFAPSALRLWLWYMEDTFVIQQVEDSHQFLQQHIDSIDPHIQFTMENPKHNGSMHFLYTLVSPGPNNTLISSLYRKPTHMDQYLYWDSNHI